MKKLIKKSVAFMAAILFIASSCDKLPIENEMALGTGKGTVVFKLTDAPFPVSLVDKAMVTIDKIEIRSKVLEPTSGTETDGTKTDQDGVYTVLSEKTQPFDLLELSNGITADMLEKSIGVGTYDLIRMHVVSANVILKDGTSFAMKIPGGMQSGLKIKLVPDLVVESGVVNEVIMDFDVSKSFTVQGNLKSKHGIKGFVFNPVIRAVVEKHSGRIEGKVFEKGNKPIAEAHIQIFSGTVQVGSALTDKKGNYAIIGVPAGDYSMTCEAEGYTAMTIDKVTVKAKGKTEQNFKMVKP